MGWNDPTLPTRHLDNALSWVKIVRKKLAEDTHVRYTGFAERQRGQYDEEHAMTKE